MDNKKTQQQDEIKLPPVPEEPEVTSYYAPEKETRELEKEQGEEVDY